MPRSKTLTLSVLMVGLLPATDVVKKAISSRIVLKVVVAVRVVVVLMEVGRIPIPGTFVLVAKMEIVARWLGPTSVGKRVLLSMGNRSMPLGADVVSVNPLVRPACGPVLPVVTLLLNAPRLAMLLILAKKLLLVKTLLLRMLLKLVPVIGPSWKLSLAIALPLKVTID